MKKLSLVFPSWSSEFGDFKFAAKKVSTFPPLNLGVVAALAEQEGWQVQLIDAHIEQLGLAEIVERVKKFNPDLVGLTSTTPFFHSAQQVAATLKKHLNIPIMLGGTHAIVAREKAFTKEFDYLFVSECELNLPDFLRQFSNGKRLPDVNGVMMRDGDKIVFHGEIGFIKDLSLAPRPARHLLANELYFMGTTRGRKKYTSIQMSRGCPYSCSFCASDLHGKRYRLRKIDDIIKELDYVVNELQVEHIYFVDDTLTQNRKFILELCEEIQKHNLKFTFEGSTRANLWDEELVSKLKECGLIRISFGLETADQRVREIIKKSNIPLESYEKANQLANKYDIETINSVIIGLPGDNYESINATVDFVASSRDLLHVTLNIAMPYPGTEMYEMALKEEHGLKLLERDFSKFQRYGSGVMEVNGISPQELVKIQKKALIKIYSKWWRYIPIVKRFGMKTIFLTGITVVFGGLFRTFSKFSSYISNFFNRENLALSNVDPPSD